jgi:hypothetical protein
MFRAAAAACLLLGAFAVAGCSSSSVEKIKTATDNFNTNVAAINGSIAAVAPTVAQGCADIQKWAMLIAPFVPNSGKAQQYFGAANGAINGYCQNVPTDINSTAAAVASAAKAAQDGYNQVKAGAS